MDAKNHEQTTSNPSKKTRNQMRYVMIPDDEYHKTMKSIEKNGEHYISDEEGGKERVIMKDGKMYEEGTDRFVLPASKVKEMIENASRGKNGSTNIASDGNENTSMNQLSSGLVRMSLFGFLSAQPDWKHSQIGSTSVFSHKVMPPHNHIFYRSTDDCGEEVFPMGDLAKKLIEEYEKLKKSLLGRVSNPKEYK